MVRLVSLGSILDTSIVWLNNIILSLTDGCSDENLSSDSSDDEVNNTGHRTAHKRAVVRPPFRPSRPNRSKSAPLPSDDEDSSEGKFGLCC